MLKQTETKNYIFETFDKKRAFLKFFWIVKLRYKSWDNEVLVILITTMTTTVTAMMTVIAIMRIIILVKCYIRIKVLFIRWINLR